MVLWKETAFPLCRAMERRWNRKVVSRVSSVIVVIRLPLLLLLLLLLQGNRRPTLRALAAEPHQLRRQGRVRRGIETQPLLTTTADEQLPQQQQPEPLQLQADKQDSALPPGAAIVDSSAAN